MSDVRIQIPLTARQRAMLDNPAKILWVGTGTKCGKSTALGTWLAQGLLTHQACAWVGPWFQRTRTGFEVIKGLLGPLISSNQVKATEGVLKITEVGNSGSIDFYSADNYQALFGANYHRVVLDEASRQPEGIFAAALTTISATNGRLKCAFNLELGSRNWAIKNLLRTQAMSPKQRLAAGEDFLTFPSGGDGLVDPALIEKMRAAMPGPLWRALYFAEIPESDLSLFRNLDQVFSGEELSEPAEGRSYVAGIDLGRKRDWSVVTVVDAESGDVVAGDRFHQISWSLQCERAAELCTKFKCSKVYCDATGVGDSVIETLQALGLEVEPFIFTQSSRKALLEGLILACDKVQITLPTTEKFAAYRREMEIFEYVLDGTSVKYAAPPGLHDDCVMSLALAIHGFKALDYGEWPLVIAMKRVGAKLGLWHGDVPKTFESEKKTPGWTKEQQSSPVMTTRPAPPFGPQPDPCTNCGSKCTVFLSGMVHCNMCSFDSYPDGAVRAPASGSRCECKVPQIREVSGFKRCTICGWQSTDSRFAVNGMNRADYFAHVGRRRR